MVSNNFIEECRNPAYKNRTGVVQIGDDEENQDSYNGYLSSIEINDSCYSNGNIIGTAIAKTSKITILDIKDYDNETFIPKIGVIYSDSTTEDINMGKYIVQSQTIDKTNKNSVLEGFDYLSKLDKEYTCGISDWANITVKDVLIDLCNQLGLVLGTNEFINQDIQVTGNNYQKNRKFRDVLSDILELACAWGEIDNQTLYFNWFNDEIVDTLDKSQYSTLEITGIYGEVNSLVIKDGSFEGENVAMQDLDSINENGETQIAIIDNGFLNTEELRQQAITSIWNRVKGFKYVACNIKSYYGKPFLKRGSKIRVEDDDGTFFDTYVLTHSFRYDGTFYSEISSPCLTKEQTEIKNTNLTPKQRLMNAEAKVLKAEARIEMLVERQEEMSSDLEENYYTKTTTDELIVDTASGLINKYTVGGGNNIFRNTGLYFESTEFDSGYEYWTGQVERVTNMASQSGTSMYLKNCTLSQIQEVPNDTYTVSFKYARLNDLSNATVTINDVEYQLDNRGIFVETVQVRTNQIEIIFNCDTINGYEIYELMANYGSTALNYGQNQNETKTDTVEISEGIKITSTKTDSTLKANADGIRIENKSGNITTEFLDTGTRTEIIEASKGLIANLLIENVDGQTWITRVGD